MRSSSVGALGSPTRPRDGDASGPRPLSSEKHRTLVLQELAETERAYVMALEALSTLYLHPLRSEVRKANGVVGWFLAFGLSSLSLAEVSQMFPQITKLLKLHRTKFLPRLKQLVESALANCPEDPGAGAERPVCPMRPADSSPNVGSPGANQRARRHRASSIRTRPEDFVQMEVDAVAQFFLTRAKSLKIYSAFVNSLERAQALVQKHQANSVLRRVCEEAEAHPLSAGQNLQSLLIKPLQRITKYGLLLDELRRKTPERATSHAELLDAKRVLDEVLRQINAHKGEVDSRGRISLARQRLESCYCDPVAASRILGSQFCSGCSVFTVQGSSQKVEVFAFERPRLLLVAEEKAGVFTSPVVTFCSPTFATAQFVGDRGTQVELAFPCNGDQRALVLNAQTPREARWLVEFVVPKMPPPASPRASRSSIVQPGTHNSEDGAGSEQDPHDNHSDWAHSGAASPEAERPADLPSDGEEGEEDEEGEGEGEDHQPPPTPPVFAPPRLTKLDLAAEVERKREEAQKRRAERRVHRAWSRARHEDHEKILEEAEQTCRQLESARLQPDPEPK